MLIIPVIDLKQGKVVHARHGNRADYKPIDSLICNSSAPHQVIDAFLELYPFSTLYIADIDAITGVGSHFELIQTLATDFPQVTFWLDCGIRQMNHRALHIGQNIRPVVGSESMENLISYKAVSYACGSRHVLSLDYHHAQSLGTTALHETAKYWPDDVICMSLNHVGSSQGVDMERLHQLQILNQQRKIPSRLYAAGGVRNIDDCEILKEAEIHGVLIASALHQQQITHQDLTDFYRHLAAK